MPHATPKATRGAAPVTLRRAPDHLKRITLLKPEVGNLADAIASGALRSSPALAAWLAEAEQELEQLTATQARANARPAADLARLLADLPKRAERAVIQLERTLAAGDIAIAGQEIHDHIGTVTIEADEHEVRLYGEHALDTLVPLASSCPNFLRARCKLRPERKLP